MSAMTLVNDSYGTRRVSQKGRYETEWPSVSVRPRLCENSGDRYLPVNFSHVDAVSGELSVPICLLAILRGDQNAFSHSLGQKRTFISLGLPTR